jgi:hypothetical protein
MVLPKDNASDSIDLENKLVECISTTTLYPGGSIMKVSQRFLVVGAVALVSAAISSAASITLTANVPLTPVSFTDTIDAATAGLEFNPALGTLNSVSVQVDATFSITLNVQNQSSTLTETYSNAKGSGEVEISGPGFTTFDLFSSTGAMSNTTGLAPGATDTYAGLIAGPVTQTVTPGSVSAYLGDFTLLFTADSFTAGGTAGPNSPNIFYNAQGFASGDVKVTYNYTPFSGTPEPATLFLMGTALVGVGLLRKRIKS